MQAAGSTPEYTSNSAALQNTLAIIPVPNVHNQQLYRVLAPSAHWPHGAQLLTASTSLLCLVGSSMPNGHTAGMQCSHMHCRLAVPSGKFCGRCGLHMGEYKLHVSTFATTRVALLICALLPLCGSSELFLAGSWSVLLGVGSDWYVCCIAQHSRLPYDMQRVPHDMQRVPAALACSKVAQLLKLS